MKPITEFEKALFAPDGEALRRQLREEFEGQEALLRRRIQALEFDRSGFLLAQAYLAALEAGRRLLTEHIDCLAQRSNAPHGH
jgi:hypothetical protein